MRTTWIGVLLFAFACGGPTIVMDGHTVHESAWTDSTRDLATIARFELECETLDFTLLAVEHKFPVDVGVTGCGNRARYVCVVRDTNAVHASRRYTGWVNNSNSQ